MNAIMPYHPAAPTLDLTPLTAFSDITHNISPLFYALKNDDFHAFAMDNGETYYDLDQGTGIALWWSLKRLYREIVRAATAQIPRSADLPLMVPAYYHIPDHLFREIDLAPPAILDIGCVEGINTLYMFAPKRTIQAFWLDFQDIGRQAVQWIEIACYHSNLLGQESSWDWDTTAQSQLDFPMHRLLTNTPTEEGQEPYTFSIITHPNPCQIDTTDASEDGDDGVNGDHPLNGCTDMVLHPKLSDFAQANPDFDIFAGQLTINTFESYIEIISLGW
ncbi:hypothetical protein M413DRAFT_70818 [Hebeloma cylindrosporum]|uniref:Uncharacterized protein n=1 Tax=Hebeloma cylindrosporum TaxID=76867 RepID=A0A0C2YMX2_HEBCY|nr:hypothetical protein M413DRAFT_70818 [Hebeloma cylindrosporum h7]